MAKPGKKTTSKTVKKKWYSVSAPDIFLEQEIAEIPANDIKSLIGKQMSVNLMTLTRDPKKQGITVSFEITGLKGDKATTEMVGYKVLPATIKKMVRRNKNRIDGSYKVKTSDGYILQVKPFLLTRTKTKGSIVKHLRKTLMNSCALAISKMPYSKFTKDLVGHKVQRNLYLSLTKIYPVSQIELRVVKLISRPENLAENKTEKKEPEKKAEEKPKKKEPKKKAEEKPKKKEPKKKAEKKSEKKPEKRSEKEQEKEDNAATEDRQE